MSGNMSGNRMHEPLSATAATLPGLASPRERSFVGVDVAAHDSPAEPLVVAPTHQLEGIELRSLAAFAALFYGAAFLALGVGIAVVWVFASVVGLMGQFEEFMRSIGFRDFQLSAPKMIVGGLLVALALVVFLTVMTVLAGALHNVMASHGRTVRVRISETPPVDTARPADEVGGQRGARALMRALRGSRDEPKPSIAAMDAGGIPAHLRH